MVQILHIRLQAPGTHESQITDVRWYDPRNGSMNVATIAGMVKFIAEDNGRAYIFDGQNSAEIEVVSAGIPYIRAKPTAFSVVSLLSLPRF